jgi:CDP-paratose 2-epimerase
VRIYDVPWLVLDSALAAKHWGWRPSVGFEGMAEEIAAHAEANPDWLEISGARPRPAQS